MTSSMVHCLFSVCDAGVGGCACFQAYSHPPVDRHQLALWAVCYKRTILCLIAKLTPNTTGMSTTKHTLLAHKKIPVQLHTCQLGRHRVRCGWRRSHKCATAYKSPVILSLDQTASPTTTPLLEQHQALPVCLFAVITFIRVPVVLPCAG